MFYIYRKFSNLQKKRKKLLLLFAYLNNLAIHNKFVWGLRNIKNMSDLIFLKEDLITLAKNG